MTPDELGGALAQIVEGAVPVETFGAVTVDVPREQWVAAATAARDDERIACDFFDWLSAYDELAEGFSVVTHLWSTRHHHRLHLRTRVPRDDARLATLTGVWRGANWHERETFEMFGVVFEGHPNLVPLLLPDGFEGNPLRKEFVLASRVAKPWPGAKEPGESDHDSGAPGRRRMLPPGVPDPSEWGPEATPREASPADGPSPAAEPAVTSENAAPDEAAP